MNYSVMLFVFTLLSFFLNELILIPFLLLFSSYDHIKLRLSSVNLLYFFAVLFSIAISVIYNFFNFNFILGVHLILVLFLTIFIRDKYFNVNNLLIIIKIFLIINLILIILDVTQFDFGLTFTSHSIPRFKSIFLEPSVASFIFIITLIILYNYDKIFSFWVLLNLFFILITFSGSGYMIIVLLVLFSLKLKFLLMKKYVIRFVLIALITIPSLYVITKSEQFDWLVAKRLERIDKGSDNSSKLRFLAPLQVAEYTLKNSPIWGFGLGSSENVITENRSSFSYFKIFDGTPTSQINNGYAIMFISGGVLLFFVHIIYIISLFRYVNSRSNHLYIFFIAYPFFSGHYANILMWTIVYLIIHLRSSHNQEIQST